MSAAEEETKIVRITLDVDVGTRSSMFQCNICLELIQSAKNHRQCPKCACTVCKSCIARLEDRKCPHCRRDIKFARNKIIAELIYPQIVTSCPNADCTAKYMFAGDHASKCEFRTVSCPVCCDWVAITTIHTHIRKCAGISWTAIEYHMFASTMSRHLLCGGEGTGYAICLNHGLMHNARYLYFWRQDGVINLFAIQLCAIGDEWIEYARDAQGKPRRVQVAHMENFDEILPVIELPDDLVEYKQLGIGAGPHLLCEGDHYQVKESAGGRWRPARLIEILWGPPRAVFTDDMSERIFTINTGADMNDYITNFDDPRIAQENATQSSNDHAENFLARIFSMGTGRGILAGDDDTSLDALFASAERRRIHAERAARAREILHRRIAERETAERAERGLREHREAEMKASLSSNTSEALIDSLIPDGRARPIWGEARSDRIRPADRAREQLAMRRAEKRREYSSSPPSRSRDRPRLGGIRDPRLGAMDQFQAMARAIRRPSHEHMSGEAKNESRETNAPENVVAVREQDAAVAALHSAWIGDALRTSLVVADDDSTDDE